MSLTNFRKCIVTITIIAISSFNQIVVKSHQNNGRDAVSIRDIYKHQQNRLNHIRNENNFHRPQGLRRDTPLTSNLRSTFDNEFKRHKIHPHYGRITEAVHPFGTSISPSTSTPTITTSLRTPSHKIHNNQHNRQISHIKEKVIEDINVPKQLHQALNLRTKDNQKNLSQIKVNNMSQKPLMSVRRNSFGTPNGLTTNSTYTIFTEATPKNSSEPSKQKIDSRHQTDINNDDYYYYYDDYDDDADDDDGDDEDDDDDDDRNDEDEEKDNISRDNDDLLMNFKRNHLHDSYRNFVENFRFDYVDDEPLNTTAAASGEITQSLTEKKWAKYGTVEAVEETRRKYYSEVQTVNAHILRISRQGECKIPRPKVIQISEASKRYVPHCTVLHRCGDDTGCCQSDVRTCVAKKTETVDLHFYAISLGMKDPIVETLSFVNHTECYCVERERYRSSSSASSRTNNLLSLEDQDNNNESKSDDHSDSINIEQFCLCPKHFSIFEETTDTRSYYSNDNAKIRKCRCDCVSSDLACQRLKTGQEGFPVDDRRCISEGRCKNPTCEFGDYATQTGRCPKPKQKRFISRWHFD